MKELGAELRFRADDHTYWRGKTSVPSVTKILDTVLGRTWMIKPEVLAKAAETGELVHEATALEVMGELDEDTVDDSIRGYLLAFRKFQQECRPKFLKTEEMIYHPAYHYAGTLDHMVEINRELGTLDKKSGVESKLHHAQVAAYHEAVPHSLDMRPKKGWVLYLRENGTYKLVLVDERPKMFEVFIAALKCYKFLETA